MKIVHLPLNIANLPGRLADAQRKMGHEVVVCSRITQYQFPADRVLPSYTDPTRFNALLLRMRRWLADFDVIHVHGGLWRSHVAYRVLKKAGMKLAVHYHGFETRSGGGLYWQDLADVQFHTPPDLYRILSKSFWIPQPFPLDQYPATAAPENDPPIFAHFSTTEHNKGTTEVIRMFRRAFGPLENRSVGVFTILTGKDAELRVYAGLPYYGVLPIMQKADVVFDQIAPFGIYGMTSVEAMALGKPALATINRGYYPVDCPVIRPRVTKLMELARDADSRRAYGRLGREYVTRVHDSMTVAESVEKGYLLANV